MEIKRWIDHENYVTKKEDKEIIHPELKTSKKLKMINNGKVSQWILIFLMPLNSSLLTLSSYDKGIIWRQSKIPYLFLLESNHVTTLRLQILLYKTNTYYFLTKRLLYNISFLVRNKSDWDFRFFLICECKTWVKKKNVFYKQ